MKIYSLLSLLVVGVVAVGLAQSPPNQCAYIIPGSTAVHSDAGCAYDPTADALSLSGSVAAPTLTATTEVVTNWISPPGNEQDVSMKNGAQAIQFKIFGNETEFIELRHTGTKGQIWTRGNHPLQLGTSDQPWWELMSDARLQPIANGQYSFGGPNNSVLESHLDRIHIKETTVASTQASNTVQLRSKDNGSGKTQLIAVFPGNVEVVLATEP